MKSRNNSTDPNQEMENKYGYYIPAVPATFDTERAKICLVKSCLVFCASLGTVGSVVSAFELSANMALIIVLLLVMSLLLSFLHYNHTLFNLCYPVIFFVFAFSIIRNRIYVNSGYQAIVNQIREAYRDYFELSYSRQTSEAIENRYLTTTFALIYLGFFLVVLLNIAISTYMSILFTILMTFPFLQFGLYIGKIPSFIYILLLLFSYTAVLFLKWSGHYTLSENYKKDKPFFVKKQVLSYKGHGRTMSQLLLLCLALSLCFSLITYPVMKSNFLADNSTSRLKASTDSVIRLFVQNGMFSFLNRYEASGGISNGRLGGVSTVSADYETDLKVTFVPTDTNTVYLKAYTGATYTSTQWLEPDFDEASLKETLGNAGYVAYSEYTAYLEARRLFLYKELNPHRGLLGKMVIENVDAAADHLYLPYYTSDQSDFSYRLDHSLFTGVSYANEPYTVEYYPYSQDFSRIIANNYDQLRDNDATTLEQKNYIQFYDMFCKLYYKDIPTQTRPAIEKAKNEIGESDTIMGQVELIQNYFAGNFAYSLSPGTTPMDADFATYFLEEQKEGYCAHFATAGTLLCRSYGIPARYVEGYVIQFNNIASASLKTGEKTEDWIDGETGLSETGVVTVDIPDANAHAWTEIYIDGFGWIPVDFTPPSTDIDTEEEYGIFQSLFQGLFYNAETNRNTDLNGDTKETDGFSKFLEDNSFLLLPLSVVVLLLLMISLLCKLIRFLRAAIDRQQAYKKGRFDEVLPYYYNLLRQAAIKNTQPLPASPVPEDFFVMLTDIFPEQTSDTKSAYHIFRAALYSKNSVTKKEADFFICYAKEIRKKFHKK